MTTVIAILFASFSIIWSIIHATTNYHKANWDAFNAWLFATSMAVSYLFSSLTILNLQHQ